MKNKKFLKTLATLTVGAVAAVSCLGFVACGDGDGEAHQHNYTWTANTDGKTHNGHCSVDGCDKPDVTNENHVYDNDTDTTCNKCDYVRTIGGGSTEKVDHTFTYSYAAIPVKTTDKAVLSQADFTGDNAFLTVANEKVTYRTGNACMEVKEGGLTVTFKGTGKITIGFSSTGGSNVSGLALIDASGAYLEATTTATKLAADDASGNKAGLYTVTGTSTVTAEFTVNAAGTYTIYCMYSYPDSSKPTGVNSRGARVQSIVMVDKY